MCLLAVLNTAANAPALAETNLLPGLIYFNGKEKLNGKLVFLFEHDYTVETNSQSSASIYEFNLHSEKLHKLTDSPDGRFVRPSDDGVCCVLYWLGAFSQGGATHGFVYSSNQGSSRTVNLEGEPQDTLVVGSHVLFTLKGYGHYAGSGFYTTTNHSDVETKIVDFNIVNGRNRTIEFPDASQWNYQQYEKMYVLPGQSNKVFFFYNANGKRLSDGKDYKEGFYSCDLDKATVLGFVSELSDAYDKSFSFKSFDGRYIFFEGNGSPITGFTLVSSPWNDSDSEDHPRKQVKVLKRFSILPALSQGTYILTGLSPDGHFALVRLQSPTHRKMGTIPGWENTYYLVDVSTGKTRTLLKDEVEAKSQSSIRGVYWVGEPK